MVRGLIGVVRESREKARQRIEDVKGSRVDGS
jgi:hypothetical protein